VNKAGSSNGLTQSAILAVQRIAKASGKTVSTGGSGGGSGSGGPAPAAIAGIVAGLVVLALVIARLRFRRPGVRRSRG
jgi:hypothetical protein